METNRSELRKVIMTALYQISVYKSNKIEYDINDVIKKLLEVENDFVNNIVYGVEDKINELDDIANKYLINAVLDSIMKNK